MACDSVRVAGGRLQGGGLRVQGGSARLRNSAICCKCAAELHRSVSSSPPHKVARGRTAPAARRRRVCVIAAAADGAAARAAAVARARQAVDQYQAAADTWVPVKFVIKRQAGLGDCFKVVGAIPEVGGRRLWVVCVVCGGALPACAPSSSGHGTSALLVDRPGGVSECIGMERLLPQAAAGFPSQAARCRSGVVTVEPCLRCGR